MPPDERLDLAKIYEDRGIQLTTAPPIIPGPPEVLSRLREIDREPLRRLDRFVEELQKYRAGLQSAYELVHHNLRLRLKQQSLVGRSAT
jgi:hypothetical protein